MRRADKECQKGHRNWRWWEARYDMKDINWPWVGTFCRNCGAQLKQNEYRAR